MALPVLASVYTIRVQQLYSPHSITVARISAAARFTTWHQTSTGGSLHLGGALSVSTSLYPGSTDTVKCSVLPLPVASKA
jgi:hypothetical protein